MRESHLKELGPQTTVPEAIAFEDVVRPFEFFSRQGFSTVSSNQPDCAVADERQRVFVRCLYRFERMSAPSSAGMK
ncbi:hypothetical protein [Rhizobium hidalgonense]|uniref:hypothetical protein n=1 Tax=Rhizobium hidalgonense TaxID=1538159 RepID=UPI002871D527|nr:hypothetical protein [Rhizobium hidalgonense]MDR9806887.1 hypothetical protein [Rhizobium hidalgonense]